MHSQTLFLKSNRLWACYWIFSTQCCQVLRRILRQFNKNMLLFSEITPLNYIFKILLLESFFFIVTDNTKTQLFYNFRCLATLLLSGGMDFVKSNSSPTVHTTSGQNPARLLPSCLPSGLSAFLAVCLPACLPFCVSAFLAACPNVILPACLSACLSSCLPF
jgi:hypothetical protein